MSRSADAEAVLTNKTPLSATTLAQLPKLRYIGVLATGYNIVDTAAARQRAIVVTNIPTYGTASVAQFAFAYCSNSATTSACISEAVRDGEWSRNPNWSFWKTPLVELSGKTMGVVGFGRIGRQTVRLRPRSECVWLLMMLSQTNAPEYPGFEWMDLDRIVSESDVLSLHCPLFADNKGMINKERLGPHEADSFSAEYVSRSSDSRSRPGRCAECRQNWGAGLDVFRSSHRLLRTRCYRRRTVS